MHVILHKKNYSNIVFARYWQSVTYLANFNWSNNTVWMLDVFKMGTFMHNQMIMEERVTANTIHLGQLDIRGVFMLTS